MNTTTKTLTSAEIVGTSCRIPSIDILRGLVIILMAIDHIRDIFAMTAFGPSDMEATTLGWFFTRWITHFCAPVFVFLAGTSAYLYGQKVDSKPALSRFLLSRGLWLILVEVLIVNPSWSFMLPTQAGFIFLQVIWVIGISMVALAGLIWLPRSVILSFSLLLIAGHNLLDGIQLGREDTWYGLWSFLHGGKSWIPTPGLELFGQPFYGVSLIYPFIPWVGVMSAGYVFGVVMKWEKSKRTTFLWRLGLGATLLFVLLRFANWYGNPNPWEVQSRGILFTFLDFLNTEKYPPSFLFLCMTLGPAFLLLIGLERKSGFLADALNVFGRVPFFFYIIHIPVLSLLAMAWHKMRYGEAFLFFNARPEAIPEAYQPRLWLIYLVWGLTLPLFYLACRWFAGVKKRYSHWWLSYL